MELSGNGRLGSHPGIVKRIPSRNHLPSSRQFTSQVSIAASATILPAVVPPRKMNENGFLHPKILFIKLYAGGVHLALILSDDLSDEEKLPCD